MKPCGSSENLKSVWDWYQPKPSGYGFNNVFSNSSSENQSFRELCKVKTNSYWVNNVSSNSLSRPIIAPSMDQNESNTSYDYYGPKISKEKSLSQNKVSLFAKLTNADNRTSSKSFNAKPNTTLERNESCFRIES